MTMPPNEDLHFPPFRLDLANERLWQGPKRVALRPKAYALLRFLAANPNRLIPQAEVMQAVWHHQYLSDGLLRGYVRELRSALGDDAKAPRFIETASGRGYRFLAEVSLAAPPPAAERTVKAVSEDPGRPSIAVLPFKGPQQEVELLGRGVATELVAELARNIDLRVVSQHSSFAVAESGASLAEIGERLRSRYLVDGTVRRDGELLRIRVELIDSHDGRIIWSSQYATGSLDVVATTDEIVRRIAGSLLSRVRSAEGRQALAQPPKTLDVYDLTLQAMSLRLQFRPETTRQARALLKQALAIDVGYAPGWLALGRLNALDAEFELTGEWQRHRAPEFLAQVRRAIALDPEVPGAYRALWQAHFTARNFGEALAAASRGVALGPSDAACWCHLSMSQLSLGQLKEALSSSEQALDLTPLPPASSLHARAGALWGASQLEEAAQVADECLTKAPLFRPARVYRICALYELKRIEEARQEAAMLLSLQPKSTTEAFECAFDRQAERLRKRSLAAASAVGIRCAASTER
jgi:TolB-like protein/tetratricopeptide (TPR) repeat protein